MTDDRQTWPNRRVLLARCPKCDRQHQFYDEAQIKRMLARGSCKLCPCPACGREWGTAHDPSCLRADNPAGRFQRHVLAEMTAFCEQQS